MTTPRPAILVVDDDLSIRALLRGTLARGGYDAIEARSGTEALALARAERPDAVLLDLGLPDRDGLELIPLLRQTGPAPILIISARDATEQKVAALDLGADDYVTKPFDGEEVLARLRAALRNRLLAGGGSEVVRAGDVAIDLAHHAVTRAGEEVHLTRKEFEILAALARHPGRVIFHGKLLEAAWPTDHDRRVDYLRIVVRNLRQKLEADPARPALIVNETGIGYRLMVS
jgi:two-component system KDP operon response regulator KdpE